MKHFRRRMLANGLAMALVVSSLVATPASAANNVDFKDIKGHWAESQIKNFLEKGYIEGYGDNTFKPDNKITRAEFIKIVNMAFGYTEKGTENFKDVNPEDWFYGEVLKAMKQGYIDGYGDGTFKPNEPISREEACKIVGVILKANGYGNTTFKDDAEIESWAKKYVKGLVDMGIIDGFKEDNTFRPEANTSRAETVKTIKGAVEYEAPSSGGGTGGGSSQVDLTPEINNESDLNKLDKTLPYKSITINIDGEYSLEEIEATTVTVNSGNATLKDCDIDTLNIGESSRAKMALNNDIIVSVIGEKTSLSKVNINSLSELNIAANITVTDLSVGNNAGGTEIKGEGSIKKATINAHVKTEIEFGEIASGGDNIEVVVTDEEAKAYVRAQDFGYGVSGENQEYYNVGFKLQGIDDTNAEAKYSEISQIEVKLFANGEEVANRVTVDGGIDKLKADDKEYGGFDGQLSASFKKRDAEEKNEYWLSSAYDFTTPDRAEIRISVKNAQGGTITYVVENTHLSQAKPEQPEEEVITGEEAKAYVRAQDFGYGVSGENQEYYNVGFKLQGIDDTNAEAKYSEISQIEVKLFANGEEVANRVTVDGGIDKLKADDKEYGGFDGQLSASFKKRDAEEKNEYWLSSAYDFTTPDRAEIRVSVKNAQGGTTTYVVENTNLN